MQRKSIFKIPLVKALTITVALKIVGFCILYFFFFAKEHRLKVNSDVIWQDLYTAEKTLNTK